MERLPAGIYYETRRARYRVRIYYCQTVVWRTYHDNRADALKALQEAIAYRRQYVRELVCRTQKPPPKTLLDLLI